LVGKPEGKRPLGKPRSRWENNIKMDVIETECEDVDWIYRDRNKEWWNLVNAVINLRVPQKARHFLI
jgi:hypothetical protein